VTIDIPNAPVHDGGVVCVPDRSEWLSALVDNRKLFSQLDRTEHFIASVRRQARRFVEKTGGRHVDPNAPLIVSGHQPELFHPGVWIKCFAGVGLARHSGGESLHVVTDHDTIKRTTVAVPAGSPDVPYVQYVPFDTWTGEVPFESHRIADSSLFDDFPKRCRECLSRYSLSPILNEFWNLCPNDPTWSTGIRFAEGRYRLEQKWGAAGRQAILSTMCQDLTSGFWLLAADVLLRLEAYRSIYNEELQSFRRANKIRSRQHPAPALTAAEHALESPFWVWSIDKPYRQPLFVHDLQDHLILLAGSTPFADVPLANRQPETLAHALSHLDSRWVIRPRALMTTAYLRLALSDLFIHGLGGARYDQWNDAVIRRFWSIEPPKFVVLTATRLLGIPNLDFGAETEVQRLKHRRRDFDWNPERYLRDDLLEHPPISNWIEDKLTLISEVPQRRGHRQNRAKQIKWLNERLRNYLSNERVALNQQLHQAENQAWRTRLLGSREYAFILHSAQSLQSLYQPWVEWS
jgi:hypothetical protein